MGDQERLAVLDVVNRRVSRGATSELPILQLSASPPRWGCSLYGPSGSLTWNSVSFAVSAGIAAPMSGRCLSRRAWAQTPRTHPISAATPALPNQESGDQAQNQAERERLHDSLTIMMTMITAVTAMAAIGSIPASLQYHRRLLSSIAAVPALTTIARIRSVIASSLMTTRGD